jgi:hypothetical protein
MIRCITETSDRGLYTKAAVKSLEITGSEHPESA